jgi:hypothetical protein
MYSPLESLVRNKGGHWAYVEQLAFFAAESAHSWTQGGGEGGDWVHAPRMDSEAIVKLRPRASRRTMMQILLTKKD